MTERVNLKPGSFYWALPVLDPDTDLEWMNKEQPARFVGSTDDGREVWFWLGIHGNLADGASDWPARWIGAEIVYPYE
jgi:hypothetical protein